MRLLSILTGRESYVSLHRENQTLHELFEESLRLQSRQLTYAMHRSYPTTNGESLAVSNCEKVYRWFELRLAPDANTDFKVMLEEYPSDSEKKEQKVTEYDIGRGSILPNAESWVHLYSLNAQREVPRIYLTLRERLIDIIIKSGYRIKDSL